MASKLNRIGKDIMSAMQNASEKGTSAYDTTAEVRRVEGDIAWVHIAGGVDETPVKLTIAAKAGDSVQVRVGGGRAWITGNATAPPTDDATAIRARTMANTAQSTAVQAQNSADVAQQSADGAQSTANSVQEMAGQLSDYVEEINDVIGDEHSGLTAQISGVGEGLADLSATYAHSWNDLKSFIKFKDENDAPNLVLGNENSEYNVVITNTMLVFRKGTTPIAFMDGSKLYVENSLSFGNFQFYQRTNGHFSLKFIG